MRHNLFCAVLALSTAGILAGCTRPQRIEDQLSTFRQEKAQCNPRNLAEAQARGNAVQRGKADRQAANVLPIIREIQALGITSLASIAGALNGRGIPTARGRTWHAASVKRIIERSTL